MLRRCYLLALALLIGTTADAAAQKKPAKVATGGGGVQWLGLGEDDAAKAAAGKRYFRRTFTSPRPADEALLDIAADPGFTVWVNGHKVGTGDDWKTVYRFDVHQHIDDKPCVIAVEVNDGKGGSSGLMVRLGYIPNGMSKLALFSDAAWKVSDTAADGWQKVGFDDKKWKPATVLGGYGKTGRWAGQTWQGGGDDRFTVPPGFKVEMAAHNPNPADPFSLVNMCFDDRGRLLVSQERGPILLCTDPDKDGACQSVVPYCDLVKNCHGMCWVNDALLLVGDGPQGTGLYRCQETAGNKVAGVTLLVKYKGPMAEHGPHAVLHGPDGKLYLVSGNHAWVQAPELAANSPLVRWPTGQMGPDQGQGKTTEDVLLPRMNDARGHAANILAPGGTVWRCDPDGTNLSLVSAGYRNHFDAAFNPDGELFSFDSDMEWDVGLPWYRAVRVTHSFPGSDFVWRTGAANTPNYYLDSLPPIAETGRGSPVGVECYDMAAFPSKYRGALFMGDWAIGCIFAVFPQKSGATYSATVEKFCLGAPMNVTDLACGPDGALYFTMGGRGTQGGVYRIAYTGPKSGPVSPSVEQPLAPWSKGRAAVSVPTASKDELLAGLKAADPFAQRKACEGLIHAGVEPPVESLIPLLASSDHTLNTAARLVLQRIDPAKWAKQLLADPRDYVAQEAIVALCKVHATDAYAEKIYDRLAATKTPTTINEHLRHLRCLQLALIHATPRSPKVKALGEQAYAAFPHADDGVNRELAIVLASLRAAGTLSQPVHEKLLTAMLASKSREQQIHYAYCVRCVHEGWTPEQKAKLLGWYETTKDWKGGASFAPFLENIVRDLSPIFTADDIGRALAKVGEMPMAAKVLLKVGKGATPAQAAQALDRITAAPLKPNDRTDLRAAVLESLGKKPAPDVQALIRRLADEDVGLYEAAAHALASAPLAANYPYFVNGLQSSNPIVLDSLVAALRKCPTKPKVDDPTAFRYLLAAAPKIGSRKAGEVVALMRHWTGKQFGAEPNQLATELNSWYQWFGQSFPKEPALLNIAGGEGPGKYKFDELLAYLEGEGKAGDATRGKAVFAKANCLKCHKYGSEGEGIGPELSAVSKRFKRSDTLEAVLYPSKVISDQYRSTTITTQQGQQITGIASLVGDTVTVVLQDATKVVLKQGDIDTQFASLVSVMPEKLFDALTKQEIADLFAFLESEPK